MEIITNTTDFYLDRETAVAIGKFDGVHIGHRRLLEEIRGQKKEGLCACVFTFDPAPAVLFGQSDGKELTTKEEKYVLFERAGVDILIEFPMDPETAAMPSEVFATEILAERMQARFLAAGSDLSFGAGGAGNEELLRKMGPELGFQVKTIAKVCLDGKEVSSTYVRSRVEQGDMRLAERLLGMPYPVMGAVVKGRQLGRDLGFPTVNLLPEESKLLPPNGVYFSQVRHRGRLYRAISNVGYKPTVTKERVMGVESYLYDFSGDIYGEQIEVYLLEFSRPEQRFESVDALRRQLERDIGTRAVYKN
ncbi:MAG: bifunctional riboflavin kinase/FAD synthetase [Lachnospiraceae bacterium]|nr:bifunctional riboflavin kinase/FAD synthetase [Butyrivibrio sp.]MCM1342531.1 bifunctional riboflavin kinase/FAD synthetase [Muribaculaceae bacterium]MCM1410341.1 bifunctional riboflavin kinase/FAD synthetase [Lachnospiraceae bacterium]